MKTEPKPAALQHDSYLTSDKTGWDDVSQFVTSLSNDPNFIAEAEKTSLNDKYSIEYADTLANFAESALTHQQGLISEKTASQIRLVANAPYMSHASEIINDYNERRKTSKLSKHEWNHCQQLKEQVVWYNQMLSGYMYSNDSESFSVISQAVSDQAIDYTRDAQDTAQLVDSVVRGARTEAATRHLLEAAGIPFRTASIQEDLHGADVFLVLPTGEYNVDIKKSLDELAARAGGYDFATSGEMFVVKQVRSHKQLLFFPGFTDSDLGDKLRLDEQTTTERKDIVAAQLMRASLKLAA